MRARSYRHHLVVVALSALSACKVAGGGGTGDTRPTEATEAALVLGGYMRLAVSDNLSTALGFDLSYYNSSFSLQAFRASVDSTLDPIANPTYECRLQSNPPPSTIKAGGYLDVGDLELSTGSDSVELPKLEDFTFGYRIGIPYSTVALRNTGYPTAMKLEHSLEVLAPSTSITIDSGANVDQTMPLMGSIVSSDPSAVTHISRSAGMTIRVAGSPGTDYVTVSLHDGEYARDQDSGEVFAKSSKVVTCTGAPDTDITIPPHLIEHFNVESDPEKSLANLKVDLVSVDRKLQQGKITDALIQSRTRHIQGGAIIDVKQNNQREQVFNAFSSVVIEP